MNTIAIAIGIAVSLSVIARNIAEIVKIIHEREDD